MQYTAVIASLQTKRMKGGSMTDVRSSRSVQLASYVLATQLVV